MTVFFDGAVVVGKESEFIDLQVPRMVVIASCAFTRLGLMAALGPQKGILSLPSITAWLALPLVKRLQPVEVLVLRLPTTLVPLLESLFFLKGFLAQYNYSQQFDTRIILLSDLAPCWLRETLKALTGSDLVLRKVSVLPSRSAPNQITACLAKGERASLYVHERAEPAGQCERGLTAGEAMVLRDLLHSRLPVQVLARRRQRSAKTIYTLRRTAMEKLGVQTLVELLRWGK
ncbi:hypothetical protein [Serratia bockelmannii]|uniref:hypothetical protein n=1 Tax=Serratia bockelmannii TaxID=2703793 RepID=UPI003FA6E4CF